MTWILLAAFVYLLVVIWIANQLDRGRHRHRQSGVYVLAYPYRVIPKESTETESGSAISAAAATRLNRILSALLLGFVGLLVLTGFNALVLGYAPPELLAETSEQLPVTDVSERAALSVWVIGMLAALAGALVTLSSRVRTWLANVLDGHADFNPDATVHKTALVLAIVILSYTSMELLLVGGVAGLAEDLQQQAPGAIDAVANLVLMVVAAFLGVGLIIRRSWPEVIERLSLRLPNQDDWVWGVGTAFICLVMVMVFSAVLTLIFSPEMLEQQGAASEQIARALGGSLWIAFLAAMGAAVGEEILFRGALQPVFGLIPTTLFFGMLHSQYAFTPGSLAILVVGLAFGILKQRQSTTAAIIAHFTYNFVLLGLAFAAIQFEEAGLMPEATESIIYVTLSFLPFSM